ncbi:hypothetical protein [Bradyrhizobium sp. CER78]|uniref:hypothetical protein n=1 Tax=Bradyrhizobium sp. CER78 TaxID=3039162 RepID=UPI00244BF53F|nr:hypothetical protein [Bradyrhizobium sp. CER78]MDH2384436.1 hypothetical protein [Bradyrhizobium sp. CER78]
MHAIAAVAAVAAVTAWYPVSETSLAVSAGVAAKAPVASLPATDLDVVADRHGRKRTGKNADATAAAAAAIAAVALNASGKSVKITPETTANLHYIAGTAVRTASAIAAFATLAAGDHRVRANVEGTALEQDTGCATAAATTAATHTSA